MIARHDNNHMNYQETRVIQWLSGERAGKFVVKKETNENFHL